ncbi:hypothetical protein, partial [Vibrio cholerae]|uniref:hypothetical protein n=1 Tax=Vibrio cholerae TaxID=666 RepID=UPI00111C6F3C
MDKFGRHESTLSHEFLRGPPGEGFFLTQDGHYDLKKKRICNVADPVESEEAANLKTIRLLTLNCESVDRMFDAKNKQIQNVAYAENELDAVNRGFLMKEVNKLKQELNDKINMILKNKGSNVIYPNTEDNNLYKMPDNNAES